MRIDRRMFLAGVAATPFVTRASAQAQWPTKPVRVISGGSAGGGSDISFRLVETRLRDKFGQPFIIENLTGAGGTTGAAAAAKATDRHTFFIANVASNAIAVSLYKKFPFDPKTELPGVARLCTVTNALVVPANTGISNVKQFLERVKVEPAKAFFGSAGPGTTSHLSGLLLGQRLGVELTHVPYKGTAANLTALLRNDVLFSVENLPVVIGNVQSGNLKILAVSQARRSPLFPDIPTLQEAGVPDFDMFSWYGVSAATATPRDVINRVSDEINAALKTEDIAARFRDIGSDAAPLYASDFDKFIAAEIEKWTPLVKSAGATSD
ncbi:tripartite tricarboxylate transporter substrate binding protein [Bradyrhizobium sp. LHD-71]|uniref:Bug family tripartite tricarboxylate transporter substrate binding protein n=1 Tax=Bradyrhizobium sp. LHD-71 TaxID=3072141 RepID=UPI00280E2D48|nr:tripartite tricarboxylate transporter substrate binding protein [Bradyrhizobium sp. LHD-71]MDQ8732799.1 tripartite tricarboxylate transporter substrate binding protein [Bradyrhizobium sp. LHD-71]